jgi:hypothetical protein
MFASKHEAAKLAHGRIKIDYPEHEAKTLQE